MARRILLLAILPMLIIGLAGTSQAWQGRMAGAGDPYGLIPDESDFLIHPAMLAQGEGITFYAHYRFTYTDVMSWDYDLVDFTSAGVWGDNFFFDTSGQEYSHNGLLGAATPIGPGRFGIFFTYDGMQGNYDGDEVYSNVFGTAYFVYDLGSDIDNFALRLLYGLPVGGFNLGGEVQFAYRQEEQQTWINETDLTQGAAMNYPWGGARAWFDLSPFMFPYDSSYWEALLKGSLEGTLGPLGLAFTLRGGFIFAGDNDWEYDFQLPVGTSAGGYYLDGGMQGWQIGGDLWIRYALPDSFALPFLVRVDYQSKTRDGSGEGVLGLAGFPYRYTHQEKNLHLEAGGGIDKAFGEATSIAAGIYYNYLQGTNDLWIWGDELGRFTYDYSDYPSHTEHQIVVRFAGEHEFSPMVALRMGMGFFYGWVGEDFDFTFSNVAGSYTDAIPLNGSHWGIGASLGGSVQFDSFTMEPFINGGWQQIDLDGDGVTTVGGAINTVWDMDLSRDEWYIGGGCSFVYDLP